MTTRIRTGSSNRGVLTESRVSDSNRRHLPYKRSALPAELTRPAPRIVHPKRFSRGERGVWGVWSEQGCRPPHRQRVRLRGGRRPEAPQPARRAPDPEQHNRCRADCGARRSDGRAARTIGSHPDRSPAHARSEPRRDDPHAPDTTRQRTSKRRPRASQRGPMRLVAESTLPYRAF